MLHMQHKSKINRKCTNNKFKSKRKENKNKNANKKPKTRERKRTIAIARNVYGKWKMINEKWKIIFVR